MPLVLTGDGAVGPLSATEVGFLDGVTSSVQSQINTKANDASLGLYFITSQAFSATTSVNINNCFTSSYDNYRISLLSTVTGADDILMRFRANGADTSSNYNRQVLIGESTSVVAQRATAATSIYFLRTSNNATIRQHSVMDVFGPQIAGVTTYYWAFANHQSAATPYILNGAGNQSDSTQFDGFTLFSTANFTGNVRVYGYKN